MLPSGETTIDNYENLKKKYGFTEDDWHKAVRLVQHCGTRDLYASGIGYKKLIQMRKDKSLFKSDIIDEITNKEETEK